MPAMTADTTALRAMSQTFVATLRSIGTAVTMASVGYHLHRTNSISAESKRTLAVLSQKVTIPLFLFTKIMYCKQDRSEDACPDVTQFLVDAWMLLLWPIYVVGIGCLVGSLIAIVSQTPRHHASTVLTACAFGNASALPITLLNVIHSSVPPTSDLGRIDPTLFLSVFMLLYPALLWGLGGWLIDLDVDFTAEATTTSVVVEKTANVEMSDVSNIHQRRNSAAEGLDRTEQGTAGVMSDMNEEFPESMALLDETENHGVSKVEPDAVTKAGDTTGDEGILLPRNRAEKANVSRFGQCRTALSSVFQPPVMGSIAGIVFVSFPSLRGLLVDLNHRDNGAPLQFLFDGLYAVGQSAVPINMMILGCNLSSSASLWKSRPFPSKPHGGLLSMRSMVGVVIGKMIVIPFLGILSAWILKTFFWDIPEDIGGAFYLVLMIVFLTPTANNVMVMVELSGSGAKEGMANVIALQYLVAPIILSCTMTIAIGVASGWTA